MSKPSDEELKLALAASVNMKEHDNDPLFMAKTLLNHHYRLGHYEKLLKAADRYMNHGQAEHERMALLKCIEDIKDMEHRNEHSDIEDFGLE